MRKTKPFSLKSSSIKNAIIAGLHLCRPADFYQIRKYYIYRAENCPAPAPIGLPSPSYDKSTSNRERSSPYDAKQGAYAFLAINRKACLRTALHEHE